MGKMKPSKFDLALKQIAAVEKESALKEGSLTSKLPQELELKDCKNHYHVALVKVIHDSKNRRYISSMTVQTFGKGAAISKLEKNYKTLGFSHAIIVHDPTTIQDKGTADLKGFEKNSIASKIRQEEQQKMNKRIDDRIKEEQEKAQKEKAKAIEEEVKRTKSSKNTALEFEGVNITESNVDQFAKDNQVDISSAKSPEGKLALVKKFIESKTK